MSGTIIKTKYSTSTSAPVDGSLQTGEMAYSFTSSKLFIGDDSVSVHGDIIGGKYFTDLLDHSFGTLTASSAILVDSNLKIDVLNVDNITLDSNTISTADANGHLILNPNGSGEVHVLASALAVVGDFTVSGSTTVIGGSTLGNLNIATNTISAVNVNGDIILTPNGSGNVNINSTQALLIPSGLVGTRPTPLSTGDGAIRYNESSGRFEGTVSGAWTGLGGVVDVDQDTYITAEEGSDDDTLRFYAAGVQEAYVNASGLYITDQVTAPIGNLTTANIGTANVTTQLQVDADANFSAGIDVTSGDVDITDNLNVTGDANIDGNTIIGGNLTVNGTTTSVNSNVTTLDDPVVTVGDGSLAAGDGLDRGVNFDWGDGSVVKTGFFGFDMQTQRFAFKPDSSASTEDYSAPWGDAQFHSLFLSGNEVIDGTFNVKGDVDLDSALNVDGNTTLVGSLSVGTTLDVTGVTTLVSQLNANGGINCDSGQFIVADTSGNVSTAGTLEVAGTTTLSSTLGVTGATTLSSTLGVTGPVDLDSTLNVDGGVTLKSTTALGSSGQMVIDSAGVMTAGIIDCGTF
jgi:hypothetical protein